MSLEDRDVSNLNECEKSAGRIGPRLVESDEWQLRNCWEFDKYPSMDEVWGLFVKDLG